MIVKITIPEIKDLIILSLRKKGIDVGSDDLNIAYIGDYEDSEFDGIEFEYTINDEPKK